MGYLSAEGLMRAVEAPVTVSEAGVVDGAGYCSACFSGHYPVAINAHELGKLVLLRPGRSDAMF